MKFELTGYVKTTVEVRDEDMLVEAIENFQDSPIGQHLANTPMQDNVVYVRCVEWRAEQFTRSDKQ